MMLHTRPSRNKIFWAGLVLLLSCFIEILCPQPYTVDWLNIIPRWVTLGVSMAVVVFTWVQVSYLMHIHQLIQDDQRGDMLLLWSFGILAIPEFFSSPYPLLASPLIWGSIYILFASYRVVRNEQQFTGAGLLLGSATLLYWPWWVFFPLFIAIIYRLRCNSWHNLGGFTLGSFFPAFIVYPTLYLFFPSGVEYLYIPSLQAITLPHFSAMQWAGFITLLLLIIGGQIAVSLFSSREKVISRIRISSLAQMIFVLLLLSGIQLHTLSANHYLLIPLTALLLARGVKIRTTWAKHLMLTLLFLFALVSRLEAPLQEITSSLFLF